MLLTVGVQAQEWTPIFEGVCLARIREDELAVYAVRIDLSAPGIRFRVTPGNGEEPLEVDARKTGAFLREQRCQVAINGSMFSPVVRREGRAVDLNGLSISDGTLVSEAREGDNALLISADNEIRFGSGPPAHNALSGIDFILREGQVVPSPGERHPRTAVGISQDKKTLYLVVIDGRQPGYSVGASVEETAAWMKRLGSWEAITLDGGGSSTLVIAGEYGLPEVVNRPSGGEQRPVGNHLGVFAAPLRPGVPPPRCRNIHE